MYSTIAINAPRPLTCSTWKQTFQVRPSTVNRFLSALEVYAAGMFTCRAALNLEGHNRSDMYYNSRLLPFPFDHCARRWRKREPEDPTAAVSAREPLVNPDPPERDRDNIFRASGSASTTAQRLGTCWSAAESCLLVGVGSIAGLGDLAATSICRTVDVVILYYIIVTVW